MLDAADQKYEIENVGTFGAELGRISHNESQVPCSSAFLRTRDHAGADIYSDAPTNMPGQPDERLWLYREELLVRAAGFRSNSRLPGWLHGAAALIATASSALVLHTLARTRDPAAFAFALIAADATYELVLFAVTPFLGGTGAFPAAIVGRLGLLSALWLIGLVAACEALRLFNSVRWRH